MSTTPRTSGDDGINRDHDRHDRDRPNLTGMYVAIAGVVIFLVSIFLDWASTADEATQTAEGVEGAVETTSTGFNGYEADSLVPFAAFLGIGFAIALLYAANIAYRRQHRGLSLSSMAVGTAVTLFSLAWVFNVPGAAERSDELGADIGTYVGILGALLWAVGSAMLAKEPETEHIDNTTTGRSRS